MSLPEEQRVINTQFRLLARREGLLPVKVPPFYQRKVDQEVETLGHYLGPLHRIVYPSLERMSQSAPGEVRDFVEDDSNMPTGLEGRAVRKYRDRLLLLPTDICAGHCQYCFRQDMLSRPHSPMHSRDTKWLDLLQDYISQTNDINEVILSGGDPMTMGHRDLARIISVLRAVGIPNIRVHTRTIVFAPQVFSQQTIDLLGANNVRLVFHIVHPYEICDTVSQTIKGLRTAGIRLYNQFPVLRHVNDHPRVLTTLLTRLDELGVRNLSVFIPDPVRHSSAFRIQLGRILRIIDELNQSTASWVNSTRLVLDGSFAHLQRWAG